MSLVLDPLSQSSHPLLGSVLRGTYQVKRIVDYGGMGIVFEAEQVRLHRKVAIKVLPVHLAQEPQMLLRFQREAELVSLLQHPHIVQIVDFDTTEQGEPYIVMEFLAGESLDQRLAREPVLPVELALRIALQVASGLAAVHGALIVHRDLKPANIFLTELPTEGVHVKLLDFGIGKRIGQQRLTGENDVIGTPDYMPPEQAQGKAAQVDQRGDQYSLAVIVYEMLAGRGPFIGDMMEILEQVVSSEAPPIEDLAPSAPAGIGPVLRRAMAKDPSQRFDTIVEFAAALRATLALASTPTFESNTNETVRLSSGPRLLASQPPPSPTIGALGRHKLAASVPLAATLPMLQRALDEAKKARSARDIDLAARLVERALAIGDSLGNGEAKAALEREEALIEGSLENRLGRRDQALHVLSSSSPTPVSLLPEEAFLLSRIDGLASAEEVLDLSPLPRLRTLRLLVRMMRQQLISNE